MLHLLLLLFGWLAGCLSGCQNILPPVDANFFSRPVAIGCIYKLKREYITHTQREKTNLQFYKFIYMCVCVCMFVCLQEGKKRDNIFFQFLFLIFIDFLRICSYNIERERERERESKQIWNKIEKKIRMTLTSSSITICWHWHWLYKCVYVQLNTNIVKKNTYNTIYYNLSFSIL